MDVRRLIGGWPVIRQVTGPDKRGTGAAVRSRHTDAITPRTAEADSVTRSICPYCAVGCGQKVFVKDGRVTQIEGDPDSPISRGRLCPKGSASRNLVQSPLRQYRVRYRRPRAREWEDLPREQARDMIADRVIKARAESGQGRHELG